jgi:hypothetical protein
MFTQPAPPIREGHDVYPNWGDLGLPHRDPRYASTLWPL